jgi:small subunit ribosomal protein S17
MKKTAVVAANYMVYYPKYNQKVARTGRYFAHDEDMGCVDGDLVHIKACRKLSKYKHYYIFSILEPNIEGRERLKLGLPVRPPDLFGYPHTRRVMKINLTSKSQSKETLAAAMQEQVQQFYKFGGQVASSPTLKGTNEESRITFDEAHKMVSPVAAERAAELGDGESQVPLVGANDMDYTELEHDMRQRKGDVFWNKQVPSDKYNYDNMKKSP